MIMIIVLYIDLALTVLKFGFLDLFLMFKYLFQSTVWIFLIINHNLTISTVTGLYLHVSIYFINQYNEHYYCGCYINGI